MSIKVGFVAAIIGLGGATWVKLIAMSPCAAPSQSASFGGAGVITGSCYFF